MSESTFDFVKGELMLVDKPLHWTSFDVVKKLRWHIRKKLGLKKIKVGHAGTLDPLATGLLVICTGKMTKEINGFMSEDKTYTGTIKIGSTTPSFDLETEIDKTYDVAHITPELMNEAANSFVGGYDQFPPIFSAKKVDGKRAYESARAGEDVKLESRAVNITKFDIDTSDFPDVTFEVACSKGTYIRSLAHDFGKKLESGAHLTELRRTLSGEFSVNEALSVEQWIAIIDGM